MSINLSEFANYLTICLSISLVILAVFNGILLRRGVKKNYKALSFYLISCCVFDLIGWGLSYYGKSNIGLLPYFNSIELALFLYFLKKEQRTYIAYILLFIGVLIGLADLFPTKVLSPGFMNIGRVFNSLVIISLVFRHLFVNFELGPQVRFYYTLLFYFSITFIHFLLLDFLIHVPSDLKFIFWMIYALSCGVFYVIITRFLWKYGKTPPF